MILTCPECATSYFVDDSKIPAEGRTVKCVSCGHRWHAESAAALELDVSEDEGALAHEPEPDPEPEPPLVSDLPGEELPKVFRAKAADERKLREAAANGVVWAGMTAVLAIVIALAVVFRVNVVKIWPQSAGAYAGVGLPVNSLGLVIEGVKAEPSLQDGHAALSVSGMIRNIEDTAITAPPLRVSLINKAGRRVSTKIAQPADAVVPPGETRHFALAIIDPPTSANELEVAFAPEAARKGVILPQAKHAATPPPEAGPLLRGPDQGAEPMMGPAPVEAAPLPSNSPYALPSAPPHE
ncbi:DUF3426 domain-containing protein [Phenylobacterium aquaticum]|uniref:DUF3426 domain-containing protein n=1 Tax=Phenylobacterium aquaticum TaxID=1763816 RepID=UPI0026F00105|nr:DUF3426 domain-containing protein [Phenylobacterium aquaticum]